MSSMAKVVHRKKSWPRLSQEGVGIWTAGEHARFLEAVELYPHGPWKLTAAYIGTRSTRQAMTHAQKYRQKLERRRRGLWNGPTKQKRPKPTRQPPNSTTSEMDMLTSQQLISVDAAAVVDWRCLEPFPLASPHPGMDAEPTWVDDCFAFFIDNFSA